MRIVVVGGGVIGLSTAFHLADRNAGQVILVEKGPIGDGSSSRAGGIITGLMGTETAVRARKISLELFHRFSREVDGYTFHDVGTLNLAEDQGAGRVEMLPLYDRLDAPYEILDADEMRRRWPLMAVPDDAWALYDPIAGYSEPDEYVAAMGAHLRNLGVEIREFEPVLEFPMQGDRVIGVRTEAGTIEADVVVCASHVWSIRLLEQFGWRMPSKVFVHQRYVSTPVSKPVILPAVNDHPRHGYYRPAFGNRVLIGIETPDREEVPPPERDTHLSSFSVDPEIRERELGRLQYVVPGRRAAVMGDREGGAPGLLRGRRADPGAGAGRARPDLRRLLPLRRLRLQPGGRPAGSRVGRGRPHRHRHQRLRAGPVRSAEGTRVHRLPHPSCRLPARPARGRPALTARRTTCPNG